MNEYYEIVLLEYIVKGVKSAFIDMEEKGFK